MSEDTRTNEELVDYVHDFEHDDIAEVGYLSEDAEAALAELKRRADLLDDHGPEGRNVTNYQYSVMRDMYESAEAMAQDFGHEMKTARKDADLLRSDLKAARQEIERLREELGWANATIEALKAIGCPTAMHPEGKLCERQELERLREDLRESDERNELQRRERVTLHAELKRYQEALHEAASKAPCPWGKTDCLGQCSACFLAEADRIIAAEEPT